MLLWFTDHNDGTEAYWTPIVFRNADLALWTQVKVGWIGTDFLLRKLFPGYAKLKDAMDALEDIEYFFDPRSDLAL